MRCIFVAAALTAALAGVVVRQLLPKPPYPGAVQWLQSNGGNGHWYAVLIEPRGITWDEANRRAQELGGHLVTITSPTEDDFVVRLINDARYWSRSGDSENMAGPWIGAVQLEGAREPDGGWRWVTGEPFLYSSWGSPQPNDGRSPHQQQQRIFYHSGDSDWLEARWGDAHSIGSTERSGVRSFIVEFDGLNPPESHPKADPYASLVVQRSTSTHINLVVKGEQVQLKRSFGSQFIKFLAPGTYKWEILDGSKDNQRLRGDSIEIQAGQRVTFTPDGLSPQVLEADESTQHKKLVVGKTQWPTSDGGNGNSYVVVVDPEGITWDEAQRRAQEMGGRLATITSPEEDSFVVDLVNQAQCGWHLGIVRNRMGPWLGGVSIIEDPDDHPAKGWRWATGESFQYSNWLIGQPNEGKPPRRLHYAKRAWGSPDTYWADNHKDLKIDSFVVEWDPIEPRELSQTDEYASVIIQQSRRPLIVRILGDKMNKERTFWASLKQTIFVAPGTYDWEVSEKSTEVANQPLCGGSIEIKAGENIRVTPDGLVSQPPPDPNGNDEPPVPDAVQWRTGDGGTGDWYLPVVACSPKPDPYVMRVSRAPWGQKETLDEETTRKATHAGADHPEASGSRYDAGG